MRYVVSAEYAVGSDRLRSFETEEEAEAFAADVRRGGQSTSLRGEFYCHECDGWTETTLDDDGFRSCRMCWDLIRCEECGDSWTDDHACV